MVEKKEANDLMLVYTLIRKENLKPHEQYNEQRLDEVLRGIKDKGCVCEPIIVDNKNYVILDGHHRFESLKRLGANFIPAYLVNYESSKIIVERWPNAKDSVSKKEVIERALSNNLYPPKTSKHVFLITLDKIQTKLSILYE
ncbi:MAG: ParB N-terminal domain-containing protein [Candidatus Micrarchaeia archaeon]